MPASVTSARGRGWNLPAILDDFRGVRNEGTHESRIDRATATRWRNRLLGVGCAGDFVELVKVRLKQAPALVHAEGHALPGWMIPASVAAAATVRSYVVRDVIR